MIDKSFTYPVCSPKRCWVATLVNVDVDPLIDLVATSKARQRWGIGPVVFAQAVLLVEGQLPVVRAQEHQYDKHEEESADGPQQHIHRAVLGMELEELVRVHRVRDEGSLVLVHCLLEIEFLVGLR